MVSSQLYCISFQYFIFWILTSLSVKTRVMYIVDCVCFTFSIYLFWLCYIKTGVEVGGCICVLYICIEELGVLGGSVCNNYMYLGFLFH